MAAALGPATPAAAGRATAVAPPISAVAGSVNVVVRADSAAASAAAKALIRREGGTVKRNLGLIGGFSATVPAGVATALTSLPGVRVTVDAAVKMKGGGWANQVGTTPLAPVIRAAGGHKADKDNPDDGDTNTGTMLTGAGVGVALIDSGVAPVQGLNGAGKVINGPGPVVRVAGAQPAQPRHVRPRHPHGRHHRRPGPGHA